MATSLAAPDRREKGIGDDFALFGCVRGFDSCMRIRLIFRSADNPAAQPTETERQKASVNLFACKSAKVGARRKAASKNGNPRLKWMKRGKPHMRILIQAN